MGEVCIAEGIAGGGSGGGICTLRFKFNGGTFTAFVGDDDVLDGAGEGIGDGETAFRGDVGGGGNNVGDVALSDPNVGGEVGCEGEKEEIVGGEVDASGETIFSFFEKINVRGDIVRLFNGDVRVNGDTVRTAKGDRNECSDRSKFDLLS